MKPAQRIVLIRKIAEKLSKYNVWDEIDLILRQFHLCTSDTWPGDKKSYVIEMVEYGDDDTLNELLNFLVEESRNNFSTDVLTKSVKKSWAQFPLHLFISHSSFEKSISYQDATNKIDFLEKFDKWDQYQLSRLIQAVKNNSQISNAWGVSLRVDALIKKILHITPQEF